MQNFDLTNFSGSNAEEIARQKRLKIQMENQQNKLQAMGGAKKNADDQN